MNIYPTKICSKCKIGKLYSEFSKCASRKLGIQPSCKLCNKIHKNKEVEKAYKISHKIEYGEYMTEYHKEWWKRDIPAYYAKSAIRRTSKLNATPSWSEFDLIKQMYIDCRLISEMTGIQHHVDHIVPIQSKIVCGLHCISNLQIITAIENYSKNNRYWPDM